MGQISMEIIASPGSTLSGNQHLNARMSQIAGDISRNAPLTIKAAKASIDYIARGGSTEQEVADLIGACLRSRDFDEGRSAFLEKRDPEFRGE